MRYDNSTSAYAPVQNEPRLLVCRVPHHGDGDGRRVLKSRANGRAGCRQRHTDARGHAHVDLHCNADDHANVNSNGHANAHPNGDANDHAFPDRHTDSNAHCHPQPDADAHADAVSGAYIHTDADTLE